MKNTSFSTFLSENREKANMSKSELARRTGFSRRAIQNWEQGKMSISIENADKLLKALGTTLTIGGTQ